MRPRKLMLRLPVYGLRLFKERSVRYAAHQANTSELAASILHGFIGRADREVLAVLGLNAQAVPLGVSMVAMGTLTKTCFRPSDVFKAGILMNAQAIILGHCHVSNHVEPSPEDLESTKRLVALGRELGIHVLDHLIVAPNGSHRSLRASHAAAIGFDEQRSDLRVAEGVAT
jgi:DNA repair protein RadC